MKTGFVCLLLACFSFPITGQITMKNNAIRAGDEIIKQQVEYKDPGRAGENVIWNFSELKPINSEYKLTYDLPLPIRDSLYILGRDTFLVKDINGKEEQLLIGIEHRTMYYYHIKDDSLLVLGHENPVTLLQHKQPVLALNYPFNYKQQTAKSFRSEGLYSSKEPISTKGEIQIESDAYGMMILPSKDTLEHVLRIRTLQTFLETDSIKMKQDNPLNLEIETYRWYAKGYRYPVFETIRSFNVSDTAKVENFTTAFFYPPQEHYYLADDPANLAILDSLWNAKNKENEFEPENGGEQMNRGNGFAYNFYPNPVKTTLYIEYYLEEQANIFIELYSLNGIFLKSFPKKQHKAGLYNESFDCTALFEGYYILRFKVNNEVVNEKILKK